MEEKRKLDAPTTGGQGVLVYLRARVLIFSLARSKTVGNFEKAASGREGVNERLRRRCRRAIRRETRAWDEGALMSREVEVKMRAGERSGVFRGYVGNTCLGF